MCAEQWLKGARATAATGDDNHGGHAKGTTVKAPKSAKSSAELRLKGRRS